MRSIKPSPPLPSIDASQELIEVLTPGFKRESGTSPRRTNPRAVLNQRSAYVGTVPLREIQGRNPPLEEYRGHCNEQRQVNADQTPTWVHHPFIYENKLRKKRIINMNEMRMHGGAKNKNEKDRRTNGQTDTSTSPRPQNTYIHVTYTLGDR